MNGVLAEVDLATGEVLHHGESLDHLAPTRREGDHLRATPLTAAFAWQHDARLEDPRSVRVVDDGSDGGATVADDTRSSGRRSTRSPARPRCSTRPRSTRTPRATRSVWPNGNLVVAWGTARRIAEHSDDGTVLLAATCRDVDHRDFRHVGR